MPSGRVYSFKYGALRPRTHRTNELSGARAPLYTDVLYFILKKEKLLYDDIFIVIYLYKIDLFK